MMDVIKKSGDKQPFSEEKLKRSIMAASEDAGITEDRARELVIGVSEKVMNNFTGRDVVPTSEIRDAVLAELDNMETTVADAWKKYEASKS